MADEPEDCGKAPLLPKEVVQVHFDVHEDIIYPLKAYLGELPAYDITLDWNQQKTEEPSRQHGFAVFYFTRTFELLGVSLGHIFKVQQSDVDMRDIVLNRRILVVNLPALESSDPRLASLGKIVVASLRGMMAQMLGSRLEGDYSEIVANKPGMSAAPFHVVLDEVAYYATSGMDRMLAMGRGLNFMFWLGFQEVSGIWARLGEKTQWAGAQRRTAGGGYSRWGCRFCRRKKGKTARVCALLASGKIGGTARIATPSRC